MSDTVINELQSNLVTLSRRLDAGERLTREVTDKVDTRLAGLDSDIAAMTRELRSFTADIGRLITLVESRHHAFLLERRIADEFETCDKVRRQARDMLRSMEKGELPPAPDIESLRIAAPSYWLASAALALSSWLQGDRAEAENRAREAVAADAVRTSLFFCLLARRLDRRDAEIAWLRRYLAAQNPDNLDPHLANVFFAAAEGAFGLEGWAVLRQAARDWAVAARAADGGGGDDGAPSPWFNLLAGKGGKTEPDKFPLLAEYSPTWPDMAKSLDWAATQTAIRDFFVGIADKKSPAPASRPPFDEGPLLASLVGEFRDEEKPLRREHRICQLLIEERGDMHSAGGRIDAEWPAHSPCRAFSDLLAAIAAGADADGTATQRLALGLGRPWMEEALKQLAAAGGALVPTRIELKLENWTGQTANGENQSDLMASFSRQWDETDQAPAKVQWLDEKLILPGIMTLVISVATAGTIIVPILALAGFSYYFYTRVKAAEAENAARARRKEERRKELLAVLSAAIAEIGNYRRFIAGKNREFAGVADVLRGLEAEREVPGLAARIRESETAARDKGETPRPPLPGWDILP